MLKHIYCNMQCSTWVMSLESAFLFVFHLTSNMFSDVELGRSICHVAPHLICRDVRTRSFVNSFLRMPTQNLRTLKCPCPHISGTDIHNVLSDLWPHCRCIQAVAVVKILQQLRLVSYRSQLKFNQLVLHLQLHCWDHTSVFPGHVRFCNFSKISGLSGFQL